jgi:hypothetical protein
LPPNILPEAAKKVSDTVDPRLKKLQDEIAAAIEEVPPDRWRLSPPGKWCAAEVLEHLYLTYTGTSKGFERVGAAGKPLVTPATWKQRGGALVLLGFGHMPSGRDAPKMARPRGLESEMVRAEIAAKIAEMDEKIRQSEEKFGTKTKLLDHPILGPLSGAEWRKFHLVHGRHHLRQIRRLAQMK